MITVKTSRNTSINTIYFLFPRIISNCINGFLTRSWEHSVEEKEKLEELGITGKRIVMAASDIPGVCEIRISPRDISMRISGKADWEDIIIRLNVILGKIFKEQVEIVPVNKNIHPA